MIAFIMMKGLISAINMILLIKIRFLCKTESSLVDLKIWLKYFTIIPKTWYDKNIKPFSDVENMNKPGF